MENSFTLAFSRNTSRAGYTYDLIGSDHGTNISFVTLTKPLDPKYQKQGAKWILQSFDTKGDRSRSLFTGLRPDGQLRYRGDIKTKGIKYDLILRLSKDLSELKIWLKKKSRSLRRKRLPNSFTRQS